MLKDPTTVVDVAKTMQESPTCRLREAIVLGVIDGHPFVAMGGGNDGVQVYSIIGSDFATNEVVYVLVDGPIAICIGRKIQPAWQTPTFQNNWFDYGGGWAPVKYRKENDRVTIAGLARNNGAVANNQIVFTLGAGYAPTEDLIFSCLSYGMSGNSVSEKAIRVNVYTSGNVRCGREVLTGTSWLSLSGIEFATTMPTS